MQPTYKTLAESNKQLELEILNRNYIEQTLKLINNRFDLVLDSSDIGFYDWNLTTDQIYYSPQWKKILGYEDNEIKEDLSEWTMRASKEGQAFILQMSRGMIDGEQGWFEKEFQMVHKHGHMVDILSRSKVLRDETGDAVRMVGVHLDISDRKKKQLLLKASEEKFSKIFHQSLLLMSISSIEDGQYIEVNDYFADLTGYSREEAIGNTSVNLGIIDAADRDRIKQGLLADGYVQDLELTLHKKDGDVFYAIYCGIIITINEQKRLLSCVSDITQRKTMEIELIQKQEQQHQAMAEKQALEKQLLQLQKIEAIGALAGGIAHDFNNILFPIIGHAEILMEDCANDHPHKESINEILIGAKRAKELVNQILTFSRQTQETAGPLKPDLIVKEVIKLIRSTLPATIKINKFIEPDCMMILADPTQIHQVAMNLITNAYHAMQDSGGVLTIKLQNLSDMDSDQEQLKLWKDPVVNLFVGDTGTGMDHLTIKKIFDPYFTTKPKGKGTGLGLSVVHGIVTNLGGKIIVTSTPGEGSRFDVYIPAIRQKHSTAPLAPHKKKSPGGNEHILLVDDEQTILDIEEKMLKRLGYTITTRNSCHEALQLILDVPDKFDMVITDMTMPEMTGDIFARKLMDIVPDLPVLICTGFSEQINLEKARSIGVKGLLFKPMIKSEFAKTIRTVLDENQRLKAP